VLASDARWDPTTIPGLSFPAGMDVSLDGELYLVNAGTDEIIVLDREGVVLRRWGESGRADGQLDFDRGDIEPIGGVAVGSDGSVYVTEPGIDRVQQFDREGTFIRRWGGPGRGPGQFLYPWDVAVGPDGSVYIVDAVRDDIQRFTSDGTHLATIGAHGSEDGQLRETASITVGADGVLYNADWGNDRVQAWDADGRFLWSLGTRDVDGVAFQRPNDVAIDAAGRMYVTDQRRIQVFDRARTLIGSWTIPEDAPGGEMYAIAVGPDGDLFGDVLYNQALYRLHALDGPSANVPARGSHESAASALGEAR